MIGLIVETRCDVGAKAGFLPLENLQRGFVKQVWIGDKPELEDENYSLYLAPLDLMFEVKRR